MLSSKNTDAEGPVTIKGLLVPSDWDEGGEIIAIALSTYSEKEYVIDRSPKGEELFAFVRQRAEIIGAAKMDDRGRNSIRVKEYEILEE